MANKKIDLIMVNENGLRVRRTDGITRTYPNHGGDEFYPLIDTDKKHWLEVPVGDEDGKYQRIDFLRLGLG